MNAMTGRAEHRIYMQVAFSGRAYDRLGARQNIKADAPCVRRDGTDGNNVLYEHRVNAIGSFVRN